MRTFAAFVTAAGVAAASSLAHADPDLGEQPPFEAELFSGGFISSSQHQFYDLPKLRGMERPNLDTLAPMFGLRAAVFFSDFIGVEADGSWTMESTQGGGDAVRVFHVGGTLLGQYPLAQRRVIPFLGLGAGVWDSQSSALGNTVHAPVHAEAGVRLFVTDSLAVRFDARLYRGPSQSDPYTLAATYGEIALGLSWVPRFKPGRPAVEVVDGDRDGDGIPDSKDMCPNEPEDKDLFMDDDGCPDPDNDGDGIPDAIDKCPLDPEDYDGFQDADGCPDVDNDDDGIPDVRDMCPNEPEDKDGYKDLDGCPDPDNDHDGIPDATDKCPNDPETINGVQDDDGCPDKGDSLVVLSPERLELLEAISFDGAKLGRKTSNVLGQIGATLRAHSEIARLRVTVYVQPTANSERDQELSEKRATAVRDWLVQWGVEPQRLLSRGFGGTKPLVPPDQHGAAALNDRVELIILERK